MKILNNRNILFYLYISKKAINYKASGTTIGVGNLKLIKRRFS